MPKRELPSRPRGYKTPFQLFKDKWSVGCGQIECEKAKRIVFSKGKIPCDFLFIGEAPGPSEDSCGLPFVGPAGHLLDAILADSLDLYRTCAVCRRGHRIVEFPDRENPYLCNGGHGEEDAEPFRLCFTNLVCCQPYDIHTGRKALEPAVTQIEGCAPRLEEFVKLCRPRVIVTVGSHAQEWLEPGYRYSVKVDPAIPRVAIVHPAFLLRQNQIVRDMGVRRSAIALQTAAQELFAKYI